MDKSFTVEELLSDNTFTDFCINPESPYRQTWNGLIKTNPQQVPVFKEAMGLLNLISPVLPQSEIQAEVNKLREVLNNRSEDEIQSTQLRNTQNRSKVLFYSLAIFLCIITTTFLFVIITDKSKESHTAYGFSTATGERKQYILPDGSTVILNSNSSFMFDKNFGKKERLIQLKGDAFFKVAKDPSKPFTVTSNGFSTTAIGTAFYVHANVSRTNYSVDLLEGKVKLEKNTSGETLYLAAGEKASWTSAKSTFIRQRYDTVSLNKWVKGILSFNNTPVHEAFAQLENWYSIDIEDRRSNHEIISINGDYVHAPLEDVLKVICFSLSCSYRIEGNKIIIQ